MPPGSCSLFCLGTSVTFAGVAAVSGERLAPALRQRLWADMEAAGLSPEETGRVFRAFLGLGMENTSPWFQLEDLLARCRTALEPSFSTRELTVFELGCTWALASAACTRGWPSAKAQAAFVARQLADACKCASAVGLPDCIGKLAERVRASEDRAQQFAAEIGDLQEPLLRALAGH